MISIPITSNAKVVDPQANEDLRLRLKDSKWLNWFLIEEATLKSLKSDADAYKEAEVLLEEAQLELKSKVSRYNEIREKNYDLKMENSELTRRIHELENPPWYKSPVFWGSSGLAAGVIGTIVLMITVSVST
jgi:hypothetical protein